MIECKYMATVKQKLVVPRIIENHGNVSKSMMEVGYTAATAKNPKNLTESTGYKQLLQEYGLTEDLITTALVEDIEKKPQRRIKELELGADILGMRVRPQLEVPNIPHQTIIVINQPVKVHEQ